MNRIAVIQLKGKKKKKESSTANKIKKKKMNFHEGQITF